MSYPSRETGASGWYDDDGPRHAADTAFLQPPPQTARSGEPSFPGGYTTQPGHPYVPSDARHPAPPLRRTDGAHPAGHQQGTEHRLAPPSHSFRSTEVREAPIRETADEGRATPVPGYRYADDLFFIALDDRSGLLRVHGDVAGPALAGALLAELAVGDWLDIVRGKVQPGLEATKTRRTVPLDALAHKILDFVLGQREPLSLKQWVEFIADFAEKEVAERLARANRILVEQRRRGLKGKSDVYKPADNNAAAWPRARLSGQARKHEALHSTDLVLVGLCDAAGLLHNILDAAPPGTYENAVNQVKAMQKAQPYMKAIFGAVRNVVTTDASKLA